MNKLGGEIETLTRRLEVISEAYKEKEAECDDIEERAREITT